MPPSISAPSKPGACCAPSAAPVSSLNSKPWKLLMIKRLRITFWRRATALAGLLTTQGEWLEGWCVVRLKRAMRR